MKKFLVFFSSIISLVTFSAFTPKPDVNSKSINCSIGILQQGQPQTVYAWRMAGGIWQQGRVTYQNTEEGLVPISFDFSGYTNGQRGQFMPDERFMPLNPNSELAKENNWTHSIRSMAGTLYLTIY